jgi:homogentisate 1,2-dioxygenase
MTIILETQLVIRPTAFAMETDLRERDYYLHWQGLGKRFHPK